MTTVSMPRNATEKIAHFTSLVITILLAILLFLMLTGIGYALIGEWAIQSNDGGLLTMTGHWDAYYSNLPGAILHPAWLALATLLLSGATMYCTSESWFNTEMGKDSGIWVLSALLGIIFLMLTITLMVLRYNIWWAQH